MFEETKINNNHITPQLIEDMVDKVINNMTNKLEQLDISLDFIASLLAGMPAGDIGTRQQRAGRSATEMPLAMKSIKEGLTSEARTYNFMVTHTKSGDTSQVNAENGNEAIMKARTGELEKHGGPEGDYKVKKLTETALRKMIREELEVILTNEEASDFFDIDPKELLGEFVEEAMGRASKATKTPPDATKAEKKAANKRVRKAAKEDSKKELDEKKLTKPEKKELKSLEKKTPKKDFKDQYGDKEGESIYYATLTKKAKEKA